MPSLFRNIHTIGFSAAYAIAFGLLSALAGWLIVPATAGAGWENIWIYAGLSGLLTAYLGAKVFIERKNKYAGARLLIASISVALFSHWLFWYLMLLVNYVQVEFFGKYMLDRPIDPLDGLLAALQYAGISLFFFGWTAIPLSIALLFLTRRIFNRRTGTGKEL